MKLLLVPYGAWWPSGIVLESGLVNWRSQARIPVAPLVSSRNFLGQGIHSNLLKPTQPATPRVDGKCVPAPAWLCIIVAAQRRVRGKLSGVAVWRFFLTCKVPMQCAEHEVSL